ncbi:MAG: nuclease-related domain-containing protein [Desulfobacterales bacterium]
MTPLQIIHENLPVLIALGVTAFALGSFWSFTAYRFARHKRSRLAAGALRFPGQSLLEKLDDLDRKADSSLVYLLLAPLLLYAAYLSYLYFGRKEMSLAGGAIIGLVCIGLIVCFFMQRRRHVAERRDVRVQYEGETAVGQELNRLMLEGYCVYHDFQGDDFRIDHILVGPKGVFAIATKARSYPNAKGQGPGAVVAYNGRLLEYPHGNDVHTIQQAESQADWLSNWLSDAVGESLIVNAVVALPGWYVKRTSPEGIPVINPKQFHSLLKYVRAKALNDEVIVQIVLHIEKKCRATVSEMEPDDASAPAHVN